MDTLLPIPTPQASKFTRLRTLLNSHQTEFLLEAHNGLSARIVEEAGFKGIWASGLALSTQFGVRDNNEASWTQVVDILEFMSDATQIPILLDGDTGYGNFNNLRRLVKKLEQREIAGVCIEDKIFPKTNSFIGGERQPLANIDEFCGKIKAGKDSQYHPDFSIIARVEALIAGWGLDEALHRAEAYHRAGADGILIHSKLSQADEILAFVNEWANRAPLIIIPTKYYSTPTEVFRTANISIVIWANHLIRAAAASMAKIAKEIHKTETLVNIEDQVASVSEIFRLQGADELLTAEKRYCKSSNEINAIVLAASQGEGLEAVTSEYPKVMLPIAGISLLRRLVDKFKHQQINNITVVTGYKPESITVKGISLVHNDTYTHSNELYSLHCALKSLSNDTIITYGDLLFRSYILRDLCHMSGKIITVVDSMFPSSQKYHIKDIAFCSKSDDRSLFSQEVYLTRIETYQNSSKANIKPNGYWVGMMRVVDEGRNWVLSALDELVKREDFLQLTIPDLLNYLIDKGFPIRVLYINGHWLDINNIEDLARAGDFAHGYQ
ncbi:phosphoenolpyruvate mutase [Candidatus Nitrosacidococcus tergens]|uniref:phosphoenolpyruvate mutase n=1 Tax=Candidatus Nitrosacidococcus tergens TaxID=553981 RepID=A0A7G1Q8G8_9GAMM|nr:phosphoenolpyruvate mutase [Candidatus Nitrosacidococcus tergens]CAB1275221.1 Phosphoenolpyruvate phosphomutase [Candidatus Nitrosacidococcus tergens]